jgi:hypothetical protein
MRHLLLLLLVLLDRAAGRSALSRDEVRRVLAATPAARGVPADFECAWRALALDFATQLQPFRPDGALRAVHDALQLTTLCNQTFTRPTVPAPPPPPTSPPPGAVGRAVAEEEEEGGAVRIFVDAGRGRDENPGTTEAAPVQHLHVAVERARLFSPLTRRTVVLRGGTHRLASTLLLTPADSGLTIAAYPGEAPVISSGYALATTWAPAAGGAGGASGAGACTWQVLSGENAMYANWPSPGIVNASRAPSAAACQGVCGAAPACTSFIYYAPDGGYGQDWDGMCFYRTDGLWRLVAEANISSGRCVPPPNIWVADLAAGGTPLPPSVTAEESSVLTVLVSTGGGQQAAPDLRAVRARFPNCDPEACVWPAGWQSGGVWTPPAMNENTTVDTVPFPRNYGPGMFSNYQIGFALTDDGPEACKALGEGDGPGGQGARGCYWCQPKGRVSGKLYFLRQPTALTVTSQQLPNAPYADAPGNGAILHYWRPSHWYSAFARIASAATDESNSTTALAWTFGGFHGAEGTDVGEDWYIDHVKEELDAPQEFYFEAATQRLFYYHNASAGTPPPAAWTFEVPLLTCLINVSGTPASPVVNVTLSGLIFTGAAASFMTPHGIPSGGDWAVARSAALTVEGSVGFSVRDSVFTRLDGNAVTLNGWNRNASISQNEFVWLGESAVVSWGRVNGSDATAGEQPWGTAVSGNLCHEIGLYEKQASCYFAALTGGATLDSNVFFNMPRAGINFNDDMAGGSLVARNLVFNTCRESQDHGPFNSWGRVPYTINFPNGSSSGGIKPVPDEIAYNFMVAGGGANSGALDHDDGSSFYDDHHNFQVYGGHKSNFDGHSKRSVSNIMAFPLVYLPQCMRIFPALPLPSPGGFFAEAFVGNTCILTDASDAYLDLGPTNCTPGPGLAAQIVLANNSVYAPPNASASVRCGGEVLPFAEWLQTGSETGTTLVDSIPPTPQIMEWVRALLNITASR